MSTSPCLTVYFDGLCPVCRREVAIYRRLHAPDAIHWSDLASSDDELRRAGIEPDAALTWLHVRDASGRIHTGLDAHLQMWRRLPLLCVLAWLVERSTAVRALVDAAYRWFTPRRPGLVRRRHRSAT